MADEPIASPSRQAAAASESPRQVFDRAVRAFADALVDPCLVLDRRSVVVHANPAASHEFPSTRPGELISASLRHPLLLNAIETARAAATPQSIELHQTVPTETWHRVVVAPLSGEFASGLLVITMRALTEQKRIDALRSDFVANASHELRTPLTSLVGFIDTLLGPAAHDAQARERFLHIMRAQADRMSRLIEDLLSLSRIEMRQHVRPTGRVDLALLLREVADGLEMQAADSNVAIALEVPGDREELYEVFENLLDNAIKYGGDGGKVEIVLAPVGDRPRFDYAVTVTDHGIGIPAEHVPRLTERFYRVDADTSRRKKGTGLGLAIVKHILNRHRGQLTIRSQPGQGTQAEVLLPK
jgi:two-component system phosphate regulon sensor histidine kinase PhoR